MVIVELNGFQAMGKVEDILPLNKKVFSGFWAYDADGHDFMDMNFGLQDIGQFQKKDNVPGVLLAETVKGKGWKRAEGNNLYHYKGLSEEEYNEAKQELCQS